LGGFKIWVDDPSVIRGKDAASCDEEAKETNPQAFEAFWATACMARLGVIDPFCSGGVSFMPLCHDYCTGGVCDHCAAGCLFVFVVRQADSYAVAKIVEFNLSHHLSQFFVSDSINWMQERGVEPLHLAVQDPKSCASANSATPAYSVIKRLVCGQVNWKDFHPTVGITPTEPGRVAPGLGSRADTARL
jgi:hypothetical protein